MRILGFILALTVWSVFALPPFAHAQLFDGPDPEEDALAEPLDSDDTFEEVTRINTADFENAYPDDGDLEMGELYEPGAQHDFYDPLLEDTVLEEPPCCGGDGSPCDGLHCGRCGGGDCARTWVDLREVINWQNARFHLHRLFAPLSQLPCMKHLHKFTERIPMRGTSWLNRPYHADWFLGVYVADQVTDGLDMDTTVVGGYRIGKDVSPNWGYETRVMFAAPDLFGTADGAAFATADAFMWDVSAVYYPWGDTTARPYLTTGLGFAHFDFVNTNRMGQTANVLAIPIGGGMKWKCNNWTLIRVELLDNISFAGGGVRAMHNLTVTGGIEVRFGGSKTGYWPWNPGSYHR